jgi:hypothetical protein
MNQRYQQDHSRGRPLGRPEEDYARNLQGRGERFGRQFDDDSPRYGARNEMNPWDEGYADAGQYLGSYPTEQGPRYYQADRPGAQYGAPRVPYPTDASYARGTSQFGYAPEEFRPRNPRPQYGASNPRQPQRDFYRPSAYATPRPLPAQQYGAPAGYARDFDEGDHDQAFGGYSPSQGGYGQSWSGYGSGGYGTMPTQDYGPAYDQELMGTNQSSAGSGYGAGTASGYANPYNQGRPGYGAGSGYTGSGYGQAAPDDYGPARRESQFGKGPKGYVRSDERLKEELSDRLMRDFEVDASDITIDVRNGVATLTGSVINRQTKHYVEDLAERCVGVRDVENRLTVRPRASKPQGGSGSLGGGDGSSTPSATGTSEGTSRSKN